MTNKKEEWIIAKGKPQINILPPDININDSVNTTMTLNQKKYRYLNHLDQPVKEGYSEDIMLQK